MILYPLLIAGFKLYQTVHQSFKALDSGFIVRRASELETLETRLLVDRSKEEIERVHKNMSSFFYKTKSVLKVHSSSEFHPQALNQNYSYYSIYPERSYSSTATEPTNGIYLKLMHATLGNDKLDMLTRRSTNAISGC